MSEQRVSETIPRWHALDAAEVFRILASREQGLTAAEALARTRRYGENKLPEPKRKGWAAIFLSQFASPLIYVLIAADVAVFALRETTDGIIIAAILLFNAVLGTVQEGRAQNTIAALARFSETRAEVIRDGAEHNIPDTGVVPGDIVLLQEGEKVPADARLLEARNLRVSEAALTGESEPVHKDAARLPTSDLPGRQAGLPTAEQKNMVFKGTTISVGTGMAVVVATGIHTVIGAISQKIAGIDTEIPLTKNLKQLARVVVYIVIALTAGIFALGVAEGRPIGEMFVAAVAISVAAVPEGLPLVLTVALAAGVWRLAKRRVLVKKLAAVEALGQAQEIAVDKTGTITRNELSIERVVMPSGEFEIAGTGYLPEPVIAAPSPELRQAALVAALCSNAHIAPNGGDWRLVGDPTEGALTVFAAKVGVHKDRLPAGARLVQDWPFDYQRKFHLALADAPEGAFLAITGAPEVIIERCTIAASEKERMLQRFYGLSSEGLRVIGFAFAQNAPRDADPDHLPTGQAGLPPLAFGGLLAMRDGLREGIAELIARAESAGLRIIMITGDHAITAKAIAAQAGIWHEGDAVITGDELDKMSEEEFRAALPTATVFARVTPEHKMKVIGDYRRRKQIIAMTGDGVNDAPSLVAADLGIAMGKIGTEVAKEAADLVLLDDNFGDIITAIEEGRNMRQGLRRTITYLFSSNFGEILLIVIALLAKFPLPVLAAQLIWMNVVTDTFFDISLSLEPKDPSLMRRGMFKARALFDRLTAARLAVVAPVIALGSFWLFHDQIADLDRARTFALTGLIVFQWFNAMNCRSETRSVFSLHPFSNRFLTATFAIVIALHLFAVYSPFMNDILRIAPLSLADWFEIAAVAVTVLIAEEIRKFFYRRQLARAPDIEPAVVH